MSDRQDLRARLLAYINETDHVSFVELSQQFGAEFGPGEYALCKGENVIFWQNMTETACTAMVELIETGAIDWQPTRPLTYWIDGCVPRLPVMKRAQKPTCPHWLPVVLRPCGRGRRQVTGCAAAGESADCRA